MRIMTDGGRCKTGKIEHEVRISYIHDSIRVALYGGGDTVVYIAVLWHK